ncbi:MAG: class I SAM-dependent methyltransferase [Phycisphaerales bacterium JB064]
MSETREPSPPVTPPTDSGPEPEGPALAEGFYDEPTLYDVLHSAGTADEVRGLLRVCERLGLDSRGPWLEPACGSGRYVRAAIARGVRIAGFDAEPAMIDYATDRLRGVEPSLYRLGVATMEGFDADELARGWRFALAFNPINTIRHLESDDDLLNHLRRVHDALQPGGVYAVGLSLSVYGAEQPSEDVWEGARGSLGVRQVVQFIPPEERGDRFEQVHNVLHVTRPGGTQTIPSAYRLRTYDRGEWEGVIERSPFTLLGCVDEEGDPMEQPMLGYAIWLLQREG